MKNSNQFSRFILAMAAYIALVLGAIWAIRQNLLPGWEVPLALLPLIPSVFVVLIVAERIRDMDELQRKIQLEALALAFGGVFLLLVTNQLLGIADAEFLNQADLIVGMSALWMLGQLVARRRYR